MKIHHAFCCFLFALFVAMLGVSAQVLAAQNPQISDSIVGDPKTGMELVLVKGGCYQMGDIFGDGNESEKPDHEVCVSDFYIGKFEVTQNQWEKIMGSNPSRNTQCGPDCPVDSVSWSMIQEYVRKLNSVSMKKYRLPTEAEWEFAARSGGKKEKWAGVSDVAALRDFVWYFDNTDGSMARKVGLKKPNGLGLYDMSGNVKEWCQDWYSDSYYKTSPKINPTGSSNGVSRVLRGGGYDDASRQVRVTRRLEPPDGIDATLGFRLALPAK